MSNLIDASIDNPDVIFHKYQRDVQRTYNSKSIEEDFTHSIIGIVTEAGELADILKKKIAYGKEVDPIHLDEEVGDLMFYIADLCYKQKLNFQAILNNNINKLKARYPEKFTEEAALNRDLQAEREILESGENHKKEEDYRDIPVVPGSLLDGLNRLDEPERSQAIYNVISSRGIEYLDTLCDIEKCVSSAFNWTMSPQGADYWSNISDNHFTKYNRKEDTSGT